MEKLTARELQLQILSIMLDVRNFCNNYGIRYSLAYGTLIGAVRHKGFIPWDDDADLIMPRPDFETFCEKYNSDRYKLIYYGNDITAIACFARIVDCRDTDYQTERPWTAQKSGIWLDIIPVDGIEDNPQDYAKRYNTLGKWCKFTYKFRRQNHHIRPEDSTWTKIKTIVARIIGLNGRVGAACIKQMVKSISRYPYEGSKFVGQCAIQDDGPIQFPAEDFSSFIPIQFEGHIFKAIGGYHHHLQQLYGEYMQLPPIDKQVSHQWWIKFYWKGE